LDKKLNRIEGKIVMKKAYVIFTLVVAAFLSAAHAEASGFVHEKFQKTFYFSSAGKATNSGLSASSPKAMVDNAALWAIPAGSVIEKVYAVVDVAVAGTTDLDVGDNDSSNGFLDGSVSLTLGTPGMYGWNAKVAGSYLRVQTAGATDAADIYVVPDAKYYGASGKSLAVDFTGAATAGKLRVVVEGYNVGS
jgi:hypothetical protein